MPVPENEFTTVEAAAKSLGVTIGWIYLLIRCGNLPATKSGRRWMVPVAAIEERKRARKWLGAAEVPNRLSEGLQSAQ